MSNLSRLQLTLLACSSVGWFAAAPINAKEPTARRGAIATVHPIATNAAVEVYRDGGNAVDAAVAAALTLGVVDGHNSGIGGGCLILIRRPDGSLLAIDGRETAPAAARRDMYLRDGKADPELSQTGPLAVATPGAVAAYDEPLKECGSLTLARLLEPGRQAAERGFRIDRNLASNLEHTQKVLRRFPGSAEALFGADGSPPKRGSASSSPTWRTTYSQIAEHGDRLVLPGPVRRSGRRVDGRQRRHPHGRGLRRYGQGARRRSRRPTAATRSSASRRPVPAASTWPRS